jgi:general secretion pathway protein G
VTDRPDELRQKANIAREEYEIVLSRLFEGDVAVPRYDHSRLADRDSGFTLIEMLIVLAIIGLVAAFVGPRLMGQLDRSKATAAKVQIRSLSASLETLRLDLGRYPDATEGLALLIEPPANGVLGEVWEGPYVDTAIPTDPWGHAYLYNPPRDRRGRPRVGTLGADGVVGGTGQDADLYFGEGQGRVAS